MLAYGLIGLFWVSVLAGDSIAVEAACRECLADSERIAECGLCAQNIQTVMSVANAGALQGFLHDLQNLSYEHCLRDPVESKACRMYATFCQDNPDGCDVNLLSRVSGLAEIYSADLSFL